MKNNERYLNCKYLDAGMDGMLCSKTLCTTCKEFNGEKCSDYILKNKPINKEKINEMASDMDYSCTKHDLWPEDAKEIAKALTILGYQKISENKVVFDRDDWQRWVYDIAEQSKKEMAKKFYDKFNENICYFKLENNSEDYKDGYVQAIADICGKLDETAIELGVDLKEYYGK